jgi:putative flippase GtrA
VLYRIIELFKSLRHHSKTKFSEHQKQLIKFTLIGFTAVGVDFVVYNELMELFAPEQDFDEFKDRIIVLSKALSFICGTTVTYTLNKYWTWRQRDRSRKRLAKFVMLYAVSWGANVMVNIFGIKLLPDPVFIFKLKDFAFLMATGTSVVINFVGQKFWVFKQKELL